MFSKRNGECSPWPWIGFFILFVSVSVYINWFDATIFFSGFYSVEKPIISNATRTEYLLVCITGNQTETPPADYPITHNPTYPYHPSCPSYFRWIHEDLRPWKETGITKNMMEQAGKHADFRLVIVNGKAYVVKYRGVFQTRDIFTLWGILQLLRWYPGRLPDLDLMFDCGDHPRLQARAYRGPNAQPPPLFGYCSHEGNLAIVFPDWTFWGWAETNIRPWRYLLKDIKEGSKRIKWKDRVPYAYYRGNLNVAPTRKDLKKCNPSSEHDWNTRLYMQDWKKESIKGFKESNLVDQCTHRYNIYIEGRAWSVSEKYILACDSMTLYVKSHYYDFFSRELQPLQHYWPIRDDNKCPSLKFAVEWGNNHPETARAIGETAAKFIEEDLKMEYVYDYMFHLLTGYAKLLKFKPEVPKEAIQLSPETMACGQSGNWKKFMEESLVTSPSETVACAMPSPSEVELRKFLDSKANATRQVEMWENEFWRNSIRSNESIRKDMVSNKTS